MNIPLYAYVALLVIYKGAENIAMHKVGTLNRRPKREWTMALIVLPYWLVIAGAMLEYLYFRPQPTYLNLGGGALCFVAATFFRVKGHLDLNQGFSMAIEKSQNAQLVQTGLYQHVRHPLYLGNLFLFVACPLFLAIRIAWVFTLLGFVGVIVRIRIEEQFLLESLPSYEHYMEKTWALVPKIY